MNIQNSNFVKTDVFKKIILFIIVFFSFSIIFYASTKVLLNGSDEEEHYLMASEISFSPFSLHLPLGFQDIDPHPPLVAYFVRLGFLLFGQESIVSGRFLFVLLGAIGIFIVFLLVSRGIDVKVAFLSIIFLCVEKYYVCHFRYAIEEGFVIFFTILTTYVFFKALIEDSKPLMLLTGVVAGIGLYGKETLLLLFPIYFIYLYSDRKFRFWFKVKELYFAVAIALCIFMPFIIFNFSNDLFSIKMVDYYAKFGVSPVALTALLGEFFSYFVDKSVIIDIFDCEYPLMNWMAGLIVTCGVVYSLKNVKGNSLVKLLLIIFLFNFGLFSIIKNDALAEPNPFLNNTDWPSMMIVSGVILASYMLISLWNKRRWHKLLIIFFIVYLGVDLIQTINLPESFYIPQRGLMLTQLKDLAHYDLDRGYYGYAKKRFERLQKWSNDEETLETARLNLLYLSNLAKSEEIKEYYIPKKNISPDEIMKQAEFFFDIGENDAAIERYQ